ncbi:MAG: transposase [Thermodesulfovibrionales bacterium]|jgi:hypothetical protein
MGDDHEDGNVGNADEHAHDDILICASWNGECKGEDDQVHLLSSAHPNLKLSDFLNNRKAASSRRIRKLLKEEIRIFFP